MQDTYTKGEEHGMQTKYSVHTYQIKNAGGRAMERRGSECNKRTHTRT